MQIGTILGQRAISPIDETKPRLLFIRSTANDRARFIRTHLKEHVKCLSLKFDVVLVDQEDCDYKQLCEAHRPDLALFESGVYVSMATRRNIRNAEAFPEIPKLGLCNADAYCITRKVFLADMYRWNIDTFFSISLAMPEYTPAISDRLFTWPNFADDDVYKDYGERKNIPVLFTGSLATHYPWRNRIYKRLRSLYPSMLCPHFGWGKEQDTERTIFGEQYARLLNAAFFVPSCGSIANELVRKHLEIPASRACLLAQRSPALEAAGFIDMKNCVFADEHDVVGKVDYLLAHRDELSSITQEGYQLVHSRHLLKHRNQLHQWFVLHRSLGANEKIVQPGPFQDLVAVPRDSTIVNSHVSPSGLDRKLLRTGDEQLERGKYSEAKELFVRCLNYHLMAEPCLRLVITSLLQGDIVGARDWSSKQLQLTLERHHSCTPDPVEWAYAILVELCGGRELKAWEYASMFPALRHRELDRARIVAGIAAGRAPETLASWTISRDSYSIHQLPEIDFNSWVRRLCIMLTACGQERVSERISSPGRAANIWSAISSGQGRGAASSLAPPIKPTTHTPSAPIGRFRSQLRSCLEDVRYVAKKVLHTAERNTGYFLPYHLSSVRQETCYHELEKLCADEECTAIVIIGAKSNDYVTQACMHGGDVNPRRPVVVCVSESEDALRRLRKRYSGKRHVRVLGVDCGEVLSAARAALMVLDGSEIAGQACTFVDIGSPLTIVLHDINTSHAYDIHQFLMASDDYELLDHSPHGAGYSIFRCVRTRDTVGVQPDCDVLSRVDVIEASALGERERSY